MLLRVEGITVHYEKAKALDDVTFEVAEGAVVAIIGVTERARAPF